MLSRRSPGIADSGPYVKRSGTVWYTNVHAGSSLIKSADVSYTSGLFGVTEEYAKAHLCGVFWNGDMLAYGGVVTGYVEDGNIYCRSGTGDGYSYRVTGRLFLV